jgi:hypothetical protein
MHNSFDGEIIAEDLQDRPDLWKSVMLTCPSGSTISGLIPLRDLGKNIWNTDTLHIWARDEAAARKLAELGEIWEADNIVIQSMETTTLMLGASDAVGSVVTMWWD